MTHICVSKLTNIGSDNGLSPGRRQAIIWNNAGILFIGLLGTNSSEILIEILTFSYKKMRLKVLSAKWRPFYLGLNVLKFAQSTSVILLDTVLCKIGYPLQIYSKFKCPLPITDIWVRRSFWKFTQGSVQNFKMIGELKSILLMNEIWRDKNVVNKNKTNMIVLVKIMLLFYKYVYQSKCQGHMNGSVSARLAP